MVSHALFSDCHALPDRIACGKSKVFPFAVSSPIGRSGPSAGARGDDEPGAATGKAATNGV